MWHPSLGISCGVTHLNCQSEKIISCTSVQNVNNFNVMQSTVRVLYNIGISVWFWRNHFDTTNNWVNDKCQNHNIYFAVYEHLVFKVWEVTLFHCVNKSVVTFLSNNSLSAAIQVCMFLLQRGIVIFYDKSVLLNIFFMAA